MLKSLISFVLSLILLVALLFAYLVVALLPPSFGRRTGWVLFGERALGPTPDLAVVPLASPIGRPRSLQLRVLRAAARVRALTLRFADGRSQIVDLDQTLAPGAATRIIDLPLRSALQSVELRYEGRGEGESDDEGRDGEQPLVRVYGLA